MLAKSGNFNELLGIRKAVNRASCKYIVLMNVLGDADWNFIGISFKHIPDNNLLNPNASRERVFFCNHRKEYC